MKKILAIICVAIFLVQCSTVPITGRKRINWVKDSNVLSSSFTQYKKFIDSSRLSIDVSKTLKIKTIGTKISKSADKFMRANGMVSEADSYKWEFNLVEDQTINAWCMPGGKIVFYTGILPILENDNGIAAVMGHEIAHAIAKHGQERMTQASLKQFGGLSLALATSQEDRRKQQIWRLAYGIASTGTILAYSRSHEIEADKLGLVFMIMAGYGGEEAAKVWVRMSEKTAGNRVPLLLRTHPKNEDRIKRLKAYLPEARRLAAQYNAQN